jgi:uncharacterized protein (DUF1015 family)
MPVLKPFRATRFTSKAGDPSGLLAPPYDVIDEAEAERLRQLDPHNSVRLVLPEGPAPERYTLASERLTAWLDKGILAEDVEPTAYVYGQTFVLPFGAGREPVERSRRCLFAALKLQPLTAGGVLPHEETHSGPTEDRLALTLACQAQLSAVFLIAGDSSGDFQAAVEAAEDGPPLLDATTPDGVRHRLWKLVGRAAEAVCRLAGTEPALIADGHHRYETALAAAERLEGRETARSVLACLAGERDSGLMVLPTHRTVRGPPPGGQWPEALADAFVVKEIDLTRGGMGGAAEGLASRAARLRSGGMVMVVPASERAYVLEPRSEVVAASDLPAEQEGVATAVFDRIVLRRALRLSADAAARRGLLDYFKDPAEAIAAAGPAGAAFLMPALDVGTIRHAVRGGERLPPKSTYFAPKIPSGLLIRKL